MSRRLVFPSFFILLHLLWRNGDEQMKVELFGMSQTLDLHGSLQCLGFGVQLVLEVCGHGRQGVVTGLDRLVETQNVTPIAHATSGRRRRTFQRKVKSTNLLKVMTFHGGMTGIGLVHLIEVFHVVFVHSRLLGQQVTQKLFHDGDLFGTASVGQSVLESWNEFHGEMCILGIYRSILHGQEGRDGHP
jgi:hypothetical protein